MPFTLSKVGKEPQKFGARSQKCVTGEDVKNLKDWLKTPQFDSFSNFVHDRLDTLNTNLINNRDLESITRMDELCTLLNALSSLPLLDQRPE